MTLSNIESSMAESGKRGFEPSHFRSVPSSSGMGRKINVEVTTLPFVEFDICTTARNKNIKEKNSNEIYLACYCN